MRKTVSEVAQPRSPDEQRFVDLHSIEFWPHPVATDAQFDGTVSKDFSRDADYQPGEDEEVYDTSYADRNEAALHELSQETLRSYVRKASAERDTAWKNNTREYKKGKDKAVDSMFSRNLSNNRSKDRKAAEKHFANAEKHGKVYDKRNAGVEIARKKIKETVDLAELSKDALERYYNKAMADRHHHEREVEAKGRYTQAGADHAKKAKKRLAGQEAAYDRYRGKLRLRKAINKPTNEAVLAELSRDTIDKYMTKADDSERAAKKARNDAEVSGGPFADRKAAAARNTIRKRNRGMNTVMKKLFGEADYKDRYRRGGIQVAVKNGEVDRSGLDADKKYRIRYRGPRPGPGKDARKSTATHAVAYKEEVMKEAVNPGDLKHLVAPGGKVTLAWAKSLEAEKARIAAENRKKNLGANVAVVKTGARTSVKEAVEVSHDRYVRSHGKKAKGTGGWMFTSKRMGDFDHNNEKEVYSHPGSASFSDAAKGAKAWAKKHGHSAAYVAEHSEVHGFDLQELSKDTLKSYLNKVTPTGKHEKPAVKAYNKVYGKGSADRARRAGADSVRQDDSDHGMSGRLVYRKESLDETYKAGAVQFKDGSKVTIKAEEASLLNKLLGSLDSHRQAEMMEHVGQSVKNYKAVVEFALATKGK